MRLSATKHVRDPTHHRTRQAARVLRGRRLSAVIILCLSLRLVARGKEVLRKLTDELAPKPASATGRMATRRAMSTRATVCKTAKDLTRQTTEIVGRGAVVAALFVAAE